MEFKHIRDDPAPLSHINIDYFDDPEIQFHFNSGRTWESETTEEEQEDGTTITKQTINTVPCPTVNVYENAEGIDILVHIPSIDPVIIDHFRVMSGEEEFFAEFVAGLEDGYQGIDEITEFTDNGDGRLGTMLKNALNEGTPDSVSVPEKPVA